MRFSHLWYYIPSYDIHYQVETFETMDESFGELAKLLQFRDKEQERVERSEKKRKGELSTEDVEMDAWDKEMKVCLCIIS